MDKNIQKVEELKSLVIDLSKQNTELRTNIKKLNNMVVTLQKQIIQNKSNITKNTQEIRNVRK